MLSLRQMPMLVAVVSKFWHDDISCLPHICALSTGYVHSSLAGMQTPSVHLLIILGHHDWM